MSQEINSPKLTDGDGSNRELDFYHNIEENKDEQFIDQDLNNQNSQNSSDEVPTFQEDLQEDMDYDQIMNMIMNQNKDLGGVVEMDDENSVKNDSGNYSAGSGENQENNNSQNNLANEFEQLNEFGSNTNTHDQMLYQDQDEYQNNNYDTNNAKTVSQHYQDYIVSSQRSFKSGAHDSQEKYNITPYQSDRLMSDEYKDRQSSTPHQFRLPENNFNQLDNGSENSNNVAQDSGNSQNESPQPKSSGPALFEKQSHISTRQMVSKMSEDFHEMLPELNEISSKKSKSNIFLTDCQEESQYQSQSEQYQSLKRHIFGQKQEELLIANNIHIDQENAEQSNNSQNQSQIIEFAIKNQSDSNSNSNSKYSQQENENLQKHEEHQDEELNQTLEQIKSLKEDNINEQQINSQRINTNSDTNDYRTHELQNTQMIEQLQMLKTQLLLSKQIIERDLQMKMKLIMKVKELQKENIMLKQIPIVQRVDNGTQHSLSSESFYSQKSKTESVVQQKTFCDNYTQTIPQILISDKQDYQSFQNRHSVSSRPSILSARPFMRSVTQKQNSRGNIQETNLQSRRFSLIRGLNLNLPKLFNFESDLVVRRNSCLTSRQGNQTFFQMKRNEISSKIERLKEIQNSKNLFSPRLQPSGSFNKFRSNPSITYDDFRTLKTVKPEELQRLSLMQRDWRSQISEENSESCSPVKKREIIVEEVYDTKHTVIWSKLEKQNKKFKSFNPNNQENILIEKQVVQKKRRNTYAAYDNNHDKPSETTKQQLKQNDNEPLRKPKIIKSERESSQSFSSQLRDDLQTSSVIISEKISTNSEDCPFQQINETFPSARGDLQEPSIQSEKVQKITQQTEIQNDQNQDQIVQIENSPVRGTVEESKEALQIIETQKSDQVVMKKISKDPGSPNSGFLNINIKKTTLLHQKQNLSKTLNLTELSKYNQNSIQMHETSQMFWKTKFEELLNEKKRQMKQIHELNSNIQSQESQMVVLRNEMKVSNEKKEETIEELMKEIVKFRVQIEQLGRAAVSQNIKTQLSSSPRNDSHVLHEEYPRQQQNIKSQINKIENSVNNWTKPNKPATGSLEAAIKTITESISAKILKTHLEQQKFQMIQKPPKTKKMIAKPHQSQVLQQQLASFSHISRASIGQSPKKMKKYINKKSEDRASKPKQNLKVQILRNSTISGESGGQVKSGTKIQGSNKSKKLKTTSKNREREQQQSETDKDYSQSFDQIDIQNLDESFRQAHNIGMLHNLDHNEVSTSSLALQQDNLDETNHNEVKQPIFVFKDKKNPQMKRSPSFAESGFASASEGYNKIPQTSLDKPSFTIDNKSVVTNIFKAQIKVLHTQGNTEQQMAIMQNNYFVETQTPIIKETKTKSPIKTNMTTIKNIIQSIKQQNLQNSKYPPIKYSKVSNDMIDTQRSKSGILKLKVKKKTVSTTNPNTSSKSKYEPFMKSSSSVSKSKPKTRSKEILSQNPHVLNSNLFRLNESIQNQGAYSNLSEAVNEYEGQVNQQNRTRSSQNVIQMSPPQYWNKLQDQQYRQRIQDDIISNDEVYEWDDDQINYLPTESQQDEKYNENESQDVYQRLKDQLLVGTYMQNVSSLRNLMHNKPPNSAFLQNKNSILRSAREPEIENKHFIGNYPQNLYQQTDNQRFQSRKLKSQTNSPFKKNMDPQSKLKIAKPSKTIDVNSKSVNSYKQLYNKNNQIDNNPKRSFQEQNNQYQSSKSIASQKSSKSLQKSTTDKIKKQSSKLNKSELEISPSESKVYGPRVAVNNNTIENKFAQFLKVHVKQDDGLQVNLSTQQITLLEDL